MPVKKTAVKHTAKKATKKSLEHKRSEAARRQAEYRERIKALLAQVPREPYVAPTKCGHIDIVEGCEWCKKRVLNRKRKTYGKNKHS